MVDLTDNDRNRISEDIAAALTREGASTEKALAPSDLKDVFCKNWPRLKRLLEFILPRLPAEIRAAVEVLIRILDQVHGMICG